MTDSKPFGYLDRLRENLEVLDEAVANARKQSKPKGKSEKALALQYGKLVRDLIQERNVTLTALKSHLLGRSEVGTPNEPNDVYGANEQVEFEREFHKQLKPWTIKDLELECEDCAKSSQEVTNYRFPDPSGRWATYEYHDLCEACNQKRLAALESKKAVNSE